MNLFRKVITVLILMTGSLFCQKPLRLYDLGDWVSLKNCNYVTSVCDGNQYVYFGTNGGVISFHKTSQTWEVPYTTSDGLADDFILAVYFDKGTETLWASHRKGYSRLTPTADRWTNFTCNGNVIRFKESDNEILAELDNGENFVIQKISGTAGGPASGKFHPAGMTKGDHMPLDGSYFMDNSYQYLMEKIILDPDLRRYDINLFWIDSMQDIYGGTNGLGLIIGNENIRRINVLPVGPLQNGIKAITFAGDALWMGGSFITPQSMSKRTGISVYDLENSQWKYFETELVYHLASEQINDLQFGQNKIWAGTDEGLSIYDFETAQWTKLTMSDGLSDQIVWTIAVDDSSAWIGSPLGLSVIDGNGKLAERIILSPFHLKIYKVVIGPENIWAGTDNGIYSINRATRDIQHWDQFGRPFAPDQASAMNCNAIGVSPNLIIFRTDHSFMQYNVENRRMTTDLKMPVMTDRKVFDIAIDHNLVWIGTDKGVTLVDLKNFYPENYTTADGLAGDAVFRILPDGDWIWFATNKGLTKYYWRKYAFAD